MSLSAIIGDKRLSINTQIKETCLDGIRDALKEIGLQVDAVDIVLLALSIINVSDLEGSIINPDCNNIGKDKDKKTMIISLNRLSDEQLGTMLALAVDTLDVFKINANIDNIVNLWQDLTEEGLKKLYCQYFIDFSTGKPDIPKFFNTISKILAKTGHLKEV